MDIATNTTYLADQLVCLRVESAEAFTAATAADVTRFLSGILGPEATPHFLPPERFVIVGVGREIPEFEVPILMHSLKERPEVRTVCRERLFATAFACDEV
jgi:hypothetical protein